MYIQLGSDWVDNVLKGSWASSIFQRDDSELKLNLPGIGKENITIDQDGDIITIKVRKSQDEAKYCYTLPYGTKTVKATYKDGVLLLKFEKDESLVKKVTIE